MLLSIKIGDKRQTRRQIQDKRLNQQVDHRVISQIPKEAMTKFKKRLVRPVNKSWKNFR